MYVHVIRETRVVKTQQSWLWSVWLWSVCLWYVSVWSVFIYRKLLFSNKNCLTLQIKLFGTHLGYDSRHNVYCCNLSSFKALCHTVMWMLLLVPMVVLTAHLTWKVKFDKLARLNSVALQFQQVTGAPAAGGAHRVNAPTWADGALW